VLFCPHWYFVSVISIVLDCQAVPQEMAINEVLMNTFNSQKCRNRNRQTEGYIHYIHTYI